MKIILHRNISYGAKDLFNNICINVTSTVYYDVSYVITSNIIPLESICHLVVKDI